MISSRPAQAEDRAVPGHGAGRPIHWPEPIADRPTGGRIKPLPNARALTSRARLWTDAAHEKRPPPAGDRAVTTANARKKAATALPAELCRSLAADRGKELSDHARFTRECGMKVVFAAPPRPWQRGTHENTDGLLRRLTDAGRVGGVPPIIGAIDSTAAALNGCSPRRSHTKRTARARTSREHWVTFVFLAPFARAWASSQNTRWFGEAFSTASQSRRAPRWRRHHPPLTDRRRRSSG